MSPKVLIVKIHTALERQYGPRRARKTRVNPLDELIFTILSQNTSDSNSLRAFQMLRRVMPSWEEVYRAPERQVAEAIHSGGLSRLKAARIKAILTQIHLEQGHFDLTFLRDLSVEETTAYLSRFKGIGPKTVACVLLFSLGRQAFPVDTHVHRVASRLQLVGPKASPEKARTLLEAIIPPALYYAMHVLLVEHGRSICKARVPLCHDCPLSKLCPSVR